VRALRRVCEVVEARRIAAGLNTLTRVGDLIERRERLELFTAGLYGDA
jgi:hypothetical protein